MDYLELALALYGVANIVARVTPTKKDDYIVGTIGKILNALLLKSKEKDG
jgi:hypothetical protein